MKKLSTFLILISLFSLIYYANFVFAQEYDKYSCMSEKILEDCVGQDIMQHLGNKIWAPLPDKDRNVDSLKKYIGAKEDDYLAASPAINHYDLALYCQKPDEKITTTSIDNTLSYNQRAWLWLGRRIDCAIKKTEINQDASGAKAGGDIIQIASMGDDVNQTGKVNDPEIEENKNSKNWFIELIKNIRIYVGIPPIVIIILLYIWVHNRRILNKYNRKKIEQNPDLKIRRCEQKRNRLYLLNNKNRICQHIVKGSTLEKIGYFLNEFPKDKNEHFSISDYEIGRDIKIYSIDIISLILQYIKKS